MSGSPWKRIFESCACRCHGYRPLSGSRSFRFIRKMSPNIRTTGLMERLKKKKKGIDRQVWSPNGTCLNKPEDGWIHPDQQLMPNAGICYGVRYLGSIEVKASMKSLDFETRTKVAREAIHRVAEAAGLTSMSKRKKTERRITAMLGDRPHMQYIGAHINLTISVESLNLMLMDTGEIIADHPMHVVSFASGGDADTLDYVGYVAKDPARGRACHVLECEGRLAEDVVTTIGQAFELRFKQYLHSQPQTVHIPDSRENPMLDCERWGEEVDYYNDRPDARPPSPGPEEDVAPPTPRFLDLRPPCNLPMDALALEDDGVYSEVKERSLDLMDFNDVTTHHRCDNGKGKRRGKNRQQNLYDNRTGAAQIDVQYHLGHVETENDRGARKMDRAEGGHDFFADTHRDEMVTRTMMETSVDVVCEKDLRQVPPSLAGPPVPPLHEPWYHGKISRKQAEKLLEEEGDFLVRQSSNSPSQFVLSGKTRGQVTHLLLVDPDGIVRTKDFIFDGVSHLISYHRHLNLPIITEDSQLTLLRPIKLFASM